MKDLFLELRDKIANNWLFKEMNIAEITRPAELIDTVVPVLRDKRLELALWEDLYKFVTHPEFYEKRYSSYETKD